MTSPDYIDLLKIVIPGLLGAGAAILGQVVSAVFAARRHTLELQQREQQLRAQYLAPIAARRIDAFETIYELIQKAIEERQLSLKDYERTRRLLLYFEVAQREKIVAALTNLLRASNSKDESALESATKTLKLVQRDIEANFGHLVVSNAVSQLIDNQGGDKS